MAGELMARGEAQVRRLAALYALLDYQNMVSPCHLEAALALWQYAEESTWLIFGDNTGDPIAGTILQAIKTYSILTDTDINNLFGRNKPAGQLNVAKNYLQQWGLIHFETQLTDGRPVTVWKLGPTP